MLSVLMSLGLLRLVPSLHGRARSIPGVVLLAFLAVSCSRTSDPAEAIRLGDEHAGAKRFAQAIEAYELALKANPRDAATRVKLKDALLGAQRWSDAASEAVRAADLLPDDAKLQKVALDLMLIMGRFEDARDRASSLLEKHPDDPEVLVLFGNAQARMPSSWSVLITLDEALRSGKTYEESRVGLRPPTQAADEDVRAEEAFKRALALDKNANVHFSLAGLYWASDRRDAAEPYLKVLANQMGDMLSRRILGFFFDMRGGEEDAEKYFALAASTKDPESLKALASFLVRQKRDKDALAILRPLADEVPSVGLSVEVAEAEMRLGDVAEAGRRADGILASQPGHARALALKAQSLFVAGSMEQAASVARRAIEADSRAVSPRMVLAKARVATGAPEEAYKGFLEALHLDPAGNEAPRALAELALELGRPRPALTYARESVRKSPQDSDAQLLLARAQVANQDFPGAERTLRPLLARQPRSTPLLVTLGDLGAARGNPSEARAAYLGALQSDSTSVAALSGLVTLDLQGRQFDAARARVNLAGHPTDPNYLLLAARVAAAEGNRSGAESYLQQALTLAPANLQAALQLAGVLSDQRRYQDARLLLEEHLKRRPLSLEARLALARTLESMGQAGDAQAVYERIVDDEPDTGPALSRLAAIHAEQDKNLDLALSVAVSAKQQLPNDPGVNDILGWIYTRKGLPRQGISLLQAAVQAVPSNAVYRYHTGMTYIDLGDTRNARVELERALKLSADFPGADRARTALGGLPQ